MITMLLLASTCAGSWAAAQAGIGDALPASEKASDATNEAIAPPVQLVLKAHQWVKVPSLPALQESPMLRMRHVGLLSDGKTAEVGAPDVFLVGEYGSGDEEDARRSGCRYVILETYRGHGSKMHLHDLNGDGVPELLVEYKTLTDSPRLCVYAFKAKDAELGYEKPFSGLQSLVRGLNKHLVTLHEDGSLELLDDWAADMNKPRPVPCRYVWREGALQPAEVQ